MGVASRADRLPILPRPERIPGGKFSNLLSLDLLIDKMGLCPTAQDCS